MIGATLYIVLCTARNRIRVRLRRLREPRYLIGAIAAVAYLYFSFFSRFRNRRVAAARQRRGTPLPTEALLRSGASAVGLLLFAGAALGWLLPFNSSMLEFSNAEMAFLFPAPVSRRALIVHRLMRSQLGLLFTAVISSLVFSTSAWPGRLRFVVGMWIMLTSARVYFTAVTLTRTRLLSNDGGERRIAWLPAGAVVAAAVVVGYALVRAFAVAPESLSDLIARLDIALHSPGARVVLWPFVTLAAPLFASGPVQYSLAVATALGVLAVTMIWVLLADDALEEAAASAAAARTMMQQARAVPVPRARATWLRLGTAGRTEGVFFWKNAVQTLRAGGFTLIRYVVPFVALVAVGASVAFSVFHLRGAADAGFAIALMTTAFVAILGPQVVRTDLRADLQHLDVLKTWPLQAGDVIRGEMLWPATLLIGIGWFAVACGTLMSFAALPATPFATRLVAALSAMLLLPALVTSQYLVHAAATVLFPAWVPIGDQRPRGLDAMGQRLVMLAAVLVVVTLLLLPAVIAGGVVWLVLRGVLGIAAFVPASVVCLTIVLLEVTAGTEALGPLFEKLDVLAVERAE